MMVRLRCNDMLETQRWSKHRGLLDVNPIISARKQRAYHLRETN